MKRDTLRNEIGRPFQNKIDLQNAATFCWAGFKRVFCSLESLGKNEVSLLNIVGLHSYGLSVSNFREDKTNRKKMTVKKYCYMNSIVSFALWKVTYISIDPSEIVHSARWVFIEMYFYLETILTLPWMFSCLNFFLSRHLFSNFIDFYTFWIHALKFKIFMPHTCRILYLSNCSRILRYKSIWETKRCGKVHLLFIENESDFLFGG